VGCNSILVLCLQLLYWYCFWVKFYCRWKLVTTFSFFSPHCMQSIDSSYSNSCLGVAWSVCLFVSLTVSPTKMAKPVEDRFVCAQETVYLVRLHMCYATGEYSWTIHAQQLLLLLLKQLVISNLHYYKVHSITNRFHSVYLFAMLL